VKTVNIKNFTNGLIKENPTFVQLLGMCPTLAVTTSAINGVGMGLATTAVLTCSNIAISMIRKFIPDKIRIPAFIVVIASFVTIVGMLMEGYVPALFKALGLFIPLIVVNCIILARAEAFAFKNGVLDSALDGIGMGIGFTVALMILGSVRELLGAGSIFGLSVLGAAYKPAIIMILPPGAFLALGLLLALKNALSKTNA
jgi:electron transport complex protein RnfE